MTSAELHKGQLDCPRACCPTEGTFLWARALQSGPHLPGQCLGLHFRQQWHISIHLSIWCCTNSPKKCAVTFSANLHNTVLLQDSNPGISTLDPPNVNVLLFSAILKNQVTHLLQTTCLQNLSKGPELSVQIKSQPHALGCIGISLWKTPACYFNSTELPKQNPSLQSGEIF